MTSVSTDGMNPFFRTTASIQEELYRELLPMTEMPVERIFFYGSGIVNEEKANVIKAALQYLYPSAGIELYSDVLAASRSIFGVTKGIACILGTGSNACLYDGEKVVGGISPLGFILGDEGSGAVLGRKLVGDFFKEVMPDALREKFEAKYHLTMADTLQRVYRTERPNQFLATFASFLSEERTCDYVDTLIRESFNQFFERNVIKIRGYNDYQIGFVGSIAYYFSEILLEICSKYNLECISIEKEPMEGLVHYHQINI